MSWRDHFDAVEAEGRIFSVGYYDADGTWFDLWTRNFPEEFRPIGLLAEWPLGAVMVRYSRYPLAHSETTLDDFIAHGLPADARKL